MGVGGWGWGLGLGLVLVKFKEWSKPFKNYSYGEFGWVGQGGVFTLVSLGIDQSISNI